MSMTNYDPMLRDGKKLPLSSTSGTFFQFLKSLFIVTPIWLFLLLPMNLVWNGVASLLCCFSKRKSNAASSEDIQVPLASSSQADIEVAEAGAAIHVDDSGRKYDVVMYGATGFTGKMAVRYLAKHYDATPNFKWAIAGRSEGKLKALRAELGEAFESLPIVIADSSKPETLGEMVRSTRVVITTAGPFAMYGTELVRLCALHGTHYADITGEGDWVRSTIDQFDSLAKASGARIVHFSGHDCEPWDLSVLALAERLKLEHGEELRSVNCYDEIKSMPSGGTMATAMNLLKSDRYVSPSGFDPLKRTAEGVAAEGSYKVRNHGFSLSYSKQRAAWVGPFVMAQVMSACVSRSNALNAYGSDVTYSEAQVYAGFMAGYVSLLQLYVFGTCLTCTPLRSLLIALGAIPKPGDGPSESFMDAGFLRVKAFALGDKGTQVESEIYYPTDPGYRDTARMLVESGMVLALQLEETRNGPGIHTPASCLGDALLRRLVASGSSFRIRSGSDGEWVEY